MVAASGRPSAQRDPRHDRGVVLASVAVLAGLGVVALGVQFVPSLRWEWAVGVLAMVGGVALAAGGRRTQAALVPVVLLGICAALLLSAGVRLQGGFGDRTVTPGAANVLRPAYRRAIGNLTLNLTALPAHTSLLSVTASVGIGNLSIIAPAGARVSASIHVGRGTFEVATCSTHVGLTPRYGLNQHASFQIAGQNPYCRGGTLHPTHLRIVASVGIGTVAADRATVEHGGSGLMSRVLALPVLAGALVAAAGGAAVLSGAGGPTLPLDGDAAAVAALTGVLALGLSPAALDDPTQEGWYAGVANALARPGMPAWAIRLIVVASAPIAGAGVAAYALAALGLALTAAPGAPVRIDPLRATATGFLGLAAVLAARASGLLLGGPELPWAVLLVGSGWPCSGVRPARCATPTPVRR